MGTTDAEEFPHLTQKRKRDRSLVFKRSGSDHRKWKREQDSRLPAAGSREDPPRRAKRRRTGRGRGRDVYGSRQWVFSPRDLSAFRDLYDRIDPQHLNWDTRKKQIHKELTCYNPSILCFQEVDRFNDLAYLLQKDGFVGVYKGRTGEASDGCAIFWKEEEFTLLHQEDIEFRKFGLRDNVAQLCLFKVSHNNSNMSKNKDASCQIAEPRSCRTLLVVNIHVLFNPNRGDIKLGQIRVLLERANKLSQEYGKTPVVISGDLNSMPQSAIYQFFTSSEIDILAYDRKKISGQIEFPLRQMPVIAQNDALRTPKCISYGMKYKWSEEEIRLAAGSRGYTHLQNPLKLCSAYQGIPGHDNTRDDNGEPLATSYHSKFMGTVDYIWHSSALVPVAVVETLPINVLKRLGGLPSECYDPAEKGHRRARVIVLNALRGLMLGFFIDMRWGSDHLALVCKFAFVDDANCSDTLHDL
ncbi:carbon catabolite repressor protein 4 homolog 5 isoform X2 [Elaeis guineensis]|uniref:Carbon catabolite repressor protein 4 homolog 5 isoform X2 n=1 Tax=Elaeis guineensis var. tenera TaxID=51953 RepID=A0A6J0PGN1_ELAGV|nr:carbon catabolite repressor protein 4 homolog 5 isoform X2 [Elaeis guineensis]